MSGETLVPMAIMGGLWVACVGLTVMHDYLRYRFNSKGTPRLVNQDRWQRAMNVRDIRIRNTFGGLQNLNRPLTDQAGKK